MPGVFRGILQSWMDRMTDEDFRALSPLIHSHVNPYGSFEQLLGEAHLDNAALKELLSKNW